MLHNREQKKKQSIQDRQSSSNSSLMWPTIGGTPINEFTTEGYFRIAFPTLFPTGAAGEAFANRVRKSSWNETILV